MNGPTLRIRRVGIDTWRENVAYLHRECPVVREVGRRLVVDKHCIDGVPGNRTSMRMAPIVTAHRLHARFEAGRGFARRMALQDSGFTVGAPGELPREFVGGGDLS